MKKLLCIYGILVFGLNASAQLMEANEKFTRTDSLRGSLNKNRNWWNVLRYDLAVSPDFATKTIKGFNKITFQSNGGGTMQIDLQQPLTIDSIIFLNRSLLFTRDSNICLINLNEAGSGNHSITVYYHGNPVLAKRPPWDGGWIFTTDKLGRPWMTVACQGLGASVWYPCKDHQSDEPEQGASISIIVPDTLMAVANGRLVNKVSKNNSTLYRWEVKNPINNYNLVPYIGKYENFNEVFDGEDGKLTCNYWVLDYETEKAKEQFKQAPAMLRCFENWFGPYPFYEDGYQLVQAPHLGMEHQSAIAYGNGFSNGYRGRDLSGSGWGNKWDYILVHESGHEWFGNNITSYDIADMWVHESFTQYSECLFTECQSGKTAGEEYLQGLRRNIRNDRSITGPYGVNKEGSGDMYPKGANMIHTIRTIINNDALFREILRGMNKVWYHKIVAGRQIEQYISKKSGIDFSSVFNQYLHGTQIPVVEWKIVNHRIMAKLANCNKDLSFRLWIPTSDKNGVWKTVSPAKWSSAGTSLSEVAAEELWNKNYYVEYKAVNPK